MIEQIRDGGFAPDAPADVDRAAVRELIRRGTLVERDQIVFHADAIDAAAARCAAELLADRPDGFTVAQFRDRTGASRKFALPLVAELDARGVTRRRDDLRIAGPGSPALTDRARSADHGLCCDAAQCSATLDRARADAVRLVGGCRRVVRLLAHLAVVLGGAFERFDLERDAVDRGDAHRVAGLDRGGAVRAGAPLRHRRPARCPRGRSRSTAVPSAPIIHSRPTVGVAKRVRVIDGMPTMNVSITPPMPAIRAIHDGRIDVPVTGSNSHRLPTIVSTMPTPVQNRGIPTWTSTANANIATTSSATAQPRAGSAARP